MRRRQTDCTRPRRAGTGQLAPKHGRKVEADQIVQRAARQIGFDQIAVDLARVLHGLGHGTFGDGVEDHAAHRGVGFDRLAVSQRLFQVPRDCFALAVGVGGKDEVRVVLQGIRDGFDVLFRIGGDLPFHCETVVGVHRTILGRQVADVPRSWPEPYSRHRDIC